MFHPFGIRQDSLNLGDDLCDGFLVGSQCVGSKVDGMPDDFEAGWIAFAGMSSRTR